MKDKINKYVENLFAGIPDSQKLRELKEELSANLADRIADALARGSGEDEAFRAAVSEIGDVSELADSMRQAADATIADSLLCDQPLDKKHVFGYLTASLIALGGILAAGIIYLKDGDLFTTVATLLPFMIVAASLFVFFGLTQETSDQYPMSAKRALAYGVATGLLLFGLLTAGMLYFQGREHYIVLSAAAPFVLPAAAIFIYLGLTERSRQKIDNQWAREWMQQWAAEWKHHYNAQTGMVRGGISGALWLFSVAIFLLVGLNGGWKYSWIVFIFACGAEALIEAVFAARRRT